MLFGREEKVESKCRFCPILEGVCRFLKDENCLELVQSLKDGKIKPEDFIKTLQSKYSEKEVEVALQKAREQV